MSTIKDREVLIFSEENINEVEAEIHEVECKSLQGDWMGEESEGECISSFFVGDFHITAKDVGSCEGGETYFGSDPKEQYKLDLQSPIEPHNDEEEKATPFAC